MGAKETTKLEDECADLRSKLTLASRQLESSARLLERINMTYAAEMIRITIKSIKE